MIDISGMWLGTYWQHENPTRFEATLVQGGNTLSGRVLDDGHLGEAQVQGSVAGRQIAFTKRYLTTAQATIHYTGTVSADGNSMQGVWTIGRLDSGQWEAHRSQDDFSADLQTALAKRVLATAAQSL